MNQKLKNQKGIALIALVLVIIVAVAAGGATYLGVRMLITGEPFLTPFEELGWIELDEEDDESDKDEKKSDKKDSDEDVDDEEEDDSKTSGTLGSVVKDRLSAEAKKSDVEHYYGSMTMADSGEYSTSEYAELYELLKLEVNLYARNDQVVEIVFTINMKEYLEKSYELYEDDFVEAGYETYEEFEEEMIPMMESAFDFGFSSAADENEEIYDYIEKYNDGGNLQIYITEDGFDSLYETYDIEEGTANVDTFCDALEESMGIKINKVK